jgi:hypothetical protein
MQRLTPHRRGQACRGSLPTEGHIGTRSIQRHRPASVRDAAPLDPTDVRISTVRLGLRSTREANPVGSAGGLETSGRFLAAASRQQSHDESR